MAKQTIDAMTCDRCGGREDCRAVEQQYRWGRITAAEANGPQWIGSQDGRTFKDICPGCITSLMKWWHNPTPVQGN